MAYSNTIESIMIRRRTTSIDVTNATVIADAIALLDAGGIYHSLPAWSSARDLHQRAEAAMSAARRARLAVWPYEDRRVPADKDEAHYIAMCAELAAKDVMCHAVHLFNSEA